MEFKVFKNENDKILKEYWLTPSEWDALDKTTVQEGDIYHIVGTIDKGDLSADVNASLAKADSSLQKPTTTLAKESFVKVGIDGTQTFDESSYVVAPSTDGTAGQVLKKTANGTEWADESGKLYVHTLYCTEYGGENVYRIIAYSTKQEEFTLDYIKAHKTCLTSAMSTVINQNDGSVNFDRVIASIDVSGTPQGTFRIYSFGATPAATLLTFVSDEMVTEL